MMKKVSLKRGLTHVAYALLIAGAVAGAARAQVGMQSSLKDTSDRAIRLIDPGISTGRPTFMLPPSLDIIPEDMPGLIPHDLAGPFPLLPISTGQKIDLISPFRLQMARENESRTWRTILGSVQIGGVAYLVYRRIKKYGLK